MKPMPESLAAGRPSLNRRDMLQLAALFGLTLTVPSLAAQPRAVPLTAEDMSLLGEVSELIIPTTDTGGAREAGVPDFVKMMLADWFSETERDHFMSGMREFSSGARQKFGKAFSEFTASQKDDYFGALLAAAEAALASATNTGGGSSIAPQAPFVVLMKRLSIFGYYTSELGATIELRQTIAAGQFVPAAVVKPGDREDSGITSALYSFSAS